MKRKPMDKALRAAVFERSQGMCDLCGCNCGFDRGHAHHRKLRSRGGDDSMANLVALCQSCHLSVHMSPALATEKGFMVPSWGDPETTPIYRHRRKWEQPGTHGWRPAEPITIEGANPS